MRILTSFALATIALSAVPAAAQVIARPERAAEIVSRTTDQTRSTQTMDFSLNLLGGYDQNDSEAFEVDPIDPDAPPVFVDSTSTGTVQAGLSYNKVNGTRVLGVTLHGGATFYGGGATRSVGPSKNVQAGFTWLTPIGTAANFSASQRLSYDSLYSFGGFEPIASDLPIGELPGSETQGVAALDSVSSDTTIGLQRQLGRRNALNGTLGYTHQTFPGNEATGDSSSRRGDVSFSRQFRRTTTANVTYGYANSEYAPLIGGGGTRPLVGHIVQGGIAFSKRLSPRRAAQFSFSAGATRTDAVSGAAETAYTFWAPSGSAQARLDLGRTWALSTNFSRGTTSLSGLTREAYSADAVSTSLGGSAGRVGLVFTAGLSRGATDVGAAEASDYRSVTGAVQATVPIGRNLSTLVEYSWYRYEVSGAAELPSSLPPEFRRSAIRAGLSLRLPIIETR
jgi:hypothetical protein